jgi:hypothetical protein
MVTSQIFIYPQTVRERSGQHPNPSELRQYKDTEKPYPHKAAPSEKFSTSGKSPDFSHIKLGIIPENKDK